MKKIYSFLFLIGFVQTLQATPGSLVSVNPDSAYQGQVLQVSLTYPSGTFLSFASAGDLKFSAPGLPTFTSNFMDIISYDPFNDMMTYEVQVPIAQPDGIYDVKAYIGQFDPFTQVFTNTDSFDLAQGFTILESNVFGRLFLDNNNNGAFDSLTGELVWPGKHIEITPDNIVLFTNSNGQFATRLQNGAHTIQYVPGPGETITTGNSPYVANITTGSMHNIGDIGVLTPAIYAVYNVGWLGQRCNRLQAGTLTINNQGNRMVDITTTLVKSANIDFRSSIPAPSVISGDTLVWNFAAVLPGTVIQVHMVDSMPGAGSSVSYTLKSIGYNGATPVDTSINFNSYVVSCSYDPNDKAVNPAGVQIPHYTLLGEELQYHINFQNTGNDTAFDITVRDTLDASLDLSTFTFLGSSALAQVSLNFNTRVAEFRMNNIMLPDSNVNEPGSHGFIDYSIQHTAPLASGTVIENTAHIYFDFNPPISTNTTFNTMVTVIPVGLQNVLSDDGIALYPNPFDGTAVIDFGKLNGIHHLNIWNETGALLVSEDTGSQTYVLSADRFAPGIYFYQVTGNGRNATGRFVVAGK